MPAAGPDLKKLSNARLRKHPLQKLCGVVVSAVPISNSGAGNTDFVAAFRDHEAHVHRRNGGKRAILRFAAIPGIYLGKRRLDEIDLTGANLENAELEQANLSDASLSCANLTSANPAGAVLHRADLRGSRVVGACFDNAQMQGADFRQATVAFMGKDNSWKVVGRDQAPARVSFLNCSLKGATLNNANLNDADFDGAVLTGATIRGTILGNASFEGAVLTGVDLSDLAVARERLKRCIMDPPPEARTRLPLLVANLASAQSWVESGGRQGGPANLEREDIRLLGPDDEMPQADADELLKHPRPGHSPTANCRPPILMAPTCAMPRLKGRICAAHPFAGPIFRTPISATPTSCLSPSTAGLA